ncbi:hypothetical protein, variant [Verruconis gallopava]|uniref:Uncharacterized protein n=1 Tax=Verruconis gallopava TaxID=253628 RepID=A0A0D2ANB8_9PEZI|nr:hypothetical protein, variant [Verruconis gallopava]KIW00619.1 hypothetical protein, variant [Verruconis gallopava]
MGLLHGIADDSDSAWTNKDTKVNWLRDLVPIDIPYARVLTYGYDASVSMFFGSNAALELQRSAETFLQELQTFRRDKRSKGRPILFICHGLGGLLVKRALIESSTKTTLRTEHLLDASISTYAIMFFGTPHGPTSVKNWLLYEKRRLSRNKQSTSKVKAEHDDGFTATRLPEILTSDFKSHAPKYCIFCSWEQEPTSLGHESAKLVETESAILNMDSVDTLGISADHSGMVKFASSKAQGYSVVIANLLRYSEHAPAYVENRWKELGEATNKSRSAAISRDLGVEQDFAPAAAPLSGLGSTDLFYPPNCTSGQFLGRHDALQRIYDAFFPFGKPNTRPGLKSFVVYGMGGSGKTELCARFAEAYRNEYCAVFTINAGSPSTITESICKIAEIGGLERTRSAGMHLLSQIKTNWLLIIDNADEATIDLPELFPRGNVAHILITTRSEDAREYGKLGHIEIGGLPERDALHLLLRRASIKEPWTSKVLAAGRAIAKVLGYLAIALTQAGNYIATVCKDRETAGLAEYLEVFATARIKIQSRIPLDQKRDVGLQKTYATFELSRKHFENKNSIAKQDAVEMLNMAAFFHFQRIPVAIFVRAIKNRRKVETGHEQTLFQRLQASISKRLKPREELPNFVLRQEVDKYDVWHAVTELRTSCLVNYDGVDDCFSLHPLVHTWVRDSLSASERKIWSLRTFNVLMEAIQLTPNLTDDDRKFHNSIMPHLDALLRDSESTHLLIRQEMGFLRSQIAAIMPQLQLWLLGSKVIGAAKCGFVLADRGYFENAVVHLQAVTNTLFHGLGIHNDKTMLAALLLAGVCWGLGRLETAIGLQHSVVTAREHVYGPSHELTLQAMDNLGYSYWLHGFHFEALDLHQQATRLMQETLGPCHEFTLTALDHLGTSLGSLYRFEERLKIHQQVLREREASLEPMHPDTLVTMDHIAVTLLDLGRPQEAKPIITTVYKERQKKLGKEHPWTLWSLANLAKVHIALDEPETAEKMLTWGIAAAERSLSKDHLGVLMGRGQLARAYARLGKLDEAEALTLDTIPLMESSRGRAHPDCVFCIYKLGQLYELKGELDRAVSAYEEAVQRANERITMKHPLAQEVDNALSAARSRTGNDKNKHAKETSMSRHGRSPSLRSSSTW